MIAFAAIVLLALSGCAGGTGALPPPPVRPNGQALWRIIHDQCVPGEESRHAPAPCAVVSIPDGVAHGFVVMKDRTGVAQHLLLPTAKITGIEDPLVLEPQAANYFARAWDERGLMQARLPHPLGRSQISIAVNSIYGRSQDQLHLHIDCLDPAVGAALKAAAIPHDDRWNHVVSLDGHAYRVRWLDEARLATTNPFKLLARVQPGARRAMGAWTLALVGATGPGGAPGFYLLADRADPAHGDNGSAEELQDHACRVAGQS
jgi:CDP-diacylglycerol pyrophosphatase